MSATTQSPVRVAVLGAGFGGLEVTTQLVQACSDAVDITLVDGSPGFVFGFSKLDVMFGKTPSAQATHLYRDAVMPGVNFVNAMVTAIDPVNRVVDTSEGTIEADVLVIALGSSLDPGATPGLIEGGHEFYSNAGAFALPETLAQFDGGQVVIGVAATPFKCPPAPSETAMLMHQFLTQRGLRDRSHITLVMPFSRPIPPSPQASEVILDKLKRYDIKWLPDRLVAGLDPQRGLALLSGDEQIPYDLFLGVPRHVAPAVVVESGLTLDGWIPVDPRTLATTYPDVYAVGDVTSAGTPKAGVFAEGQAKVAADHIIARIKGELSDAAYDGFGRCYIEFGEGEVGQVDISFAPGQRPDGQLFGPNLDLVKDKEEFGTSRVQRWFGRSW